MVPGPVTVEDEVLHEMGGPVQVHYGAEWTAIYNETLDMLKQVFRTEGDVHIMVGSGTAALDAAVGSITVPGETVIVGRNGFFGMRLEEICRAYGLEVVRVEEELGEQLRPEAFEQALERNPGAALLAVVHLETSTAVLNPLRAITEIAKAYDVPVVVDAVSSLGGVEFDMDSWGIDLGVAASQKCLGAPPGLGPIAISSRAWEIMKSKPERNHGWYLNLQTWKRYAEDWADWHPFPITMSTNTVLALRAGLQSLLDEGIQSRIQRYTRLAMRLRNGARKLGLQPFTPDDELAPVLTAIYGPEGVDTGEIVRYLLDEHEIRVSIGLGEGLKGRIFRVGHMSPTLSEADIDAVLDGLAAFLETQK
jgi:alanine-glyoxylate transaminase/serine-glyoxylate transaminase/serine-pyruvate transaminase